MISLLTSCLLSCLLVITVTGGQGYKSGYQEYEDVIGKLTPLQGIPIKSAETFGNIFLKQLGSVYFYESNIYIML